MTPMWLDKIFNFTVERHEIKRPGGKPYYLIPTSTGIGVLHTTEGSSIKGAVAAFQKASSPPHFCVGENRIVQLRPVGVQAAALHDPANQKAFVQIEIVGFSKQTLWMPDAASINPLIALVAYAAQNFGITLRVPFGWADDCSDLKGQIWASNNSRRKTAEKTWGTEFGWFHHMEVPQQGPSWHWDCGAMQRSVILQKAQELINATK